MCPTAGKGITPCNLSNIHTAFLHANYCSYASEVPALPGFGEGRDPKYISPFLEPVHRILEPGNRANITLRARAQGRPRPGPGSSLWPIRVISGFQDLVNWLWFVPRSLENGMVAIISNSLNLPIWPPHLPSGQFSQSANLANRPIG